MTHDERNSAWAERAALEQFPAVSDIVTPRNISDPAIREFLQRLANILAAVREAKEVRS